MIDDIVKRIYRSKSDIENLSRLRTLISDETDNFDYKKVVVNKPWGYEYLLYENTHVAIWVLYIKQNHATSMHCHPNKKSSLIVLEGSVICSHLEGYIERESGEGLLIDEAVFHATKAVSKDGAFVMEIESPPNKKDLVRLKDEYGREQGYEGEGQMSRNLTQYTYIDFHENLLSARKTRELLNCRITICFLEKRKDAKKRIKSEKGKIICMLKGKIHNSDGNILLATGDASSLEMIQKGNSIIAIGDIIYLIIDHYGRKSKSN